MQIYLTFFLISVIWCCIIDVSGFIEEMEGYLTKVLRMKTKARIPKPLSCSLCQTHIWGIVAMFVLGELTILNYAVLLLVSVMTPVTTEVILFTRGLLMKGIVSLGRWIGI